MKFRRTESLRNPIAERGFTALHLALAVVGVSLLAIGQSALRETDEVPVTPEEQRQTEIAVETIDSESRDIPVAETVPPGEPIMPAVPNKLRTASVQEQFISSR